MYAHTPGTAGSLHKNVLSLLFTSNTTCASSSVVNDRCLLLAIDVLLSSRTISPLTSLIVQLHGRTKERPQILDQNYFV